MADTNDQGVTFGQWLLAQKHRDGAVGDLAVAAMADRRFPRHGSPDDVRNWRNAMHAEGDMHGIVDDAVSEWVRY